MSKQQKQQKENNRMTALPRSPHARPAWRWLAGGLGIAMSLVMLLAGCGGSTTGGSTTSTTHCTVTTPGHLVNSGKLTVATDTTYAPAEFEDPNNPGKFIGYDVELANEIGDRMCLTTQIVKATFGATLLQEISGPALGSQKYDISVSSWTIRDDRLALVHMIPYFQAGESILVPKGNPKNIKSINDMCGKIVAAQDGTAELDELNQANGDQEGDQAPVCKTNKVRIYHNADQSLVAQQVLTNSADASYQDQPVTDYYVKQNSSKLESGGVTVAPAPQGIVVRKDASDMETGIRSALKAMVTDGTYQKILDKWGVGAGAYTSQL
jgi:polar amino acid transport system substrate-binding protein